jgi:hypothetical protein
MYSSQCSKRSCRQFDNCWQNDANTLDVLLSFTGKRTRYDVASAMQNSWISSSFPLQVSEEGYHC